MHGANYVDSLADFFSAPVLPMEYGGEGPSIHEACQDWTNHLLRAESLLQRIAAHPTGDIEVKVGAMSEGPQIRTDAATT